MKLGHNITFGIELECFVPQDTPDFQAGAYHNGRQVTRADDGWNGQRDGSIKRIPRGYRGVEVVSPILKGLEGLAQVWDMVEYLKSVGAKSNKTCGLHVHVGASHLTPEQIKILKGEMRKFETMFYGLGGAQAKHRWNNHTFCRHSDLWNFTRYQSLNLQNLATIGTVEFRCFPATFNPEVILTIIQACVALVAKVSQDDVEYNVTGERITDPIVSATTFFNEYLTDTRTYIAPEEPINDVAGTMMQQTRRARTGLLNVMGQGYDL